MGNDNKKMRLQQEHIENLELIRSTHDIKEKNILLQEKIHQFGMEKHRAEIERLINLDNHHYDIEKRKIEAMVRKNDQFNERQLKIINNDFLNNQKELENEKLRIQCIHEENKIKEMNKYNSYNNKLKCDFESTILKIEKENQENIMKINKDSEIRRQELDNIKNKDTLNHQIELLKIEKERKKDLLTYEKDMHEMRSYYSSMEEENKRVNERLLRKLDRDYEIRNKEIEENILKNNNERDIKMCEINSKFNIEINKVLKTIEANDAQKQRNHEEKMMQMKENQKIKQQNHEEKMKKMKEISLDKKRNHEIVIKKIEDNRKIIEQNHEKEMLKIKADIDLKTMQMQFQMKMFEKLMDRPQNLKNQGENPENNNVYNINFSMPSPNFESSFMNMMNNNNNKPEN